LKKVFDILDPSMIKVCENAVRISPHEIRRPAGATIAYMSLSDINVKLDAICPVVGSVKWEKKQ
jgi:hypothetical protein